jgi:protein associated with RNAse G/E
LVPGERVVTRAWKYDGFAHWVVDGIALGSDADGEWIYQPAGSFVARPGAAFTAGDDAVVLIPASGEWIATFHGGVRRNGLLIYIDVSTEIGWSRLASGEWEVHSVDMDLDVVERAGQTVYIDDEDEFEQHSEELGYPQELIEAMRAEAAKLLPAVGHHEAPFDGRAHARFSQGRALVGRLPE